MPASTFTAEIQPNPAQPSIELRFHVRFAETDLMGIVHHSNYLVWFEEARSAFMRLLGTSYAQFEAEGLSLVVSEVAVRYLAPARYDRLVVVRCTLEQLRSRYLAFAYTVLEAESEQTLATGQTKHICITHTGQVTRIPQTWRDRFAPPPPPA
jgi:acyl-CoA thioester hydrolase